MNKIAIVGHPSTRIKDVEDLLQRCGMGRPLPSKREGMLPQDIAKTLCKAHRCPPIEEVGSCQDIRQIDAGPVWHGLALDLMLGNLDQPFWGWADEQGVFLLDYWSNLDPQLVFVLVYDEPKRALLAGDHAVDDASPSRVRRQLDGWHAYNAALLHFYLRHPDRTMLVSAQQVKRAADSYLAQLQRKLDAPLSEVREDAVRDALSTERLPAPIQSVLTQLSIGTNEVGSLFQADGAIEQYLAAEMLAQHPAAMQLYEELQSSASLPSDTSPSAQASAEDAWKALFDRRSTMAELLARVHERFQQTQADHDTAQNISASLLENRDSELADLQCELSHRDSLLEQSRRLTEDLQSQLTAERARVSSLQSQSDGLNLTIHRLREESEQQVRSTGAERDQWREESTQLLMQLHQVQEELESTCLAAEKTRHELKEALGAQSSLAADLERANAEVAQLKQSLAAQATQPVAPAPAPASGAAGTLAKELQQENELLLMQLHQVQEELERYYLENVRLRSGAMTADMPAPAHALTGAAERVKQQLTYRLGARVIEQNRTMTGRIFLLWGLRREAQAWRQERRLQGERKLPKLSEYADAAEAERVKKHLSYRLGTVVMRLQRHPLGWLALPWALRAEANAFHREKKASA